MKREVYVEKESGEAETFYFGGHKKFRGGSSAANKIQDRLSAGWPTKFLVTGKVEFRPSLGPRSRVSYSVQVRDKEISGDVFFGLSPPSVHCLRSPSPFSPT